MNNYPANNCLKIATDCFTHVKEGKSPHMKE